jgi:hypothetical protein
MLIKPIRITNVKRISELKGDNYEK